MKKAEIILLVSILVFLFIKLFFAYLPGINVITILLLTILSTIYFYFGSALFNNIRIRTVFKRESYKGISTTRIIGAIAAGLSLSITLMGILFKIMQWPGASFNLIIGGTGISIVSVICIFKYITTKSSFYTKILSRNFIFGIIAFVLYITPQITWIEISYKNNPTIIEAYRNALDNPDKPELWNEVEKVKQKEFDQE